MATFLCQKEGDKYGLPARQTIKLRKIRSDLCDDSTFLFLKQNVPLTNNNLYFGTIKAKYNEKYRTRININKGKIFLIEILQSYLIHFRTRDETFIYIYETYLKTCNPSKNLDASTS